MNHEEDKRLYEDVGRRISIAREKQNPKMFQAGLARALGVTRASVSNIERGEQRISLALLYEVANVLDMKLGDLLPPLSDYFSAEMEFGGKKHNLPSSVKKQLQGLIDED